MEYSKHHMNHYRIHLVQTDKFKKINVQINFKRKLDPEEITIRRFLSFILLNSSAKYKQERQLNIEVENLYNIGINSSVGRSGKYSILSFSMNLLDEKYTEEGMIQKSFEFLKELIFHPNVEGQSFEQHAFDYVKQFMQEEIESFQDNPARYSNYRLYQETAPDSVLSYQYVGTKEQLEKITPQNLYEYYRSIIEEDMLDCFVVGNVEEENIKQIIEKIIPVYDRNLETEKHELELLEKKEEQVIVEEGDYNQSKLAISFTLDALTDFESQYVFQIFNYIFGGGSDSKLFQTVREKNSLCYSIGASYHLLDHLLVINAGIDFKSFDQCITLIKKCLKEMQSGKFKKEDIDKAKTVYISGCQEMLDSPISILNNFISKEYINLDLIEEKMKKIKKVNKKMVMELGKKIHIHTIYLLKGGNEDEKDTSC